MVQRRGSVMRKAASGYRHPCLPVPGHSYRGIHSRSSEDAVSKETQRIFFLSAMAKPPSRRPCILPGGGATSEQWTEPKPPARRTRERRSTNRDAMFFLCPCWCLLSKCIPGLSSTQPQTEKEASSVCLESLPSAFAWADTDEVYAVAHECIICLNGLQPGESCRRLACQHVFHQPCIDRWLQQKGGFRCPLCNSHPNPQDATKTRSSDAETEPTASGRSESTEAD